MPSDPRDFDGVTIEQHDILRDVLDLSRPGVEIRWQDATGERRQLLERRAVLGSAVGADLVVADPAVSRIHAEFELRTDGVWVRDLGSKNGTFVEGVQVTGAKVPNDGQVRVGGTTLHVVTTAQRATVEVWPVARFGPLLGKSAAMRELFAVLAQVARTDAAVLVHGETGTGKELVARAIHEASARAGGPFVVIDCAALPENLIEAELFGHARGAFTGAVGARAGALEEADGGTVFLDEIGELPLAMQPKLLRALESRTVRRVGESAYRKVDVRFVSATHRDLRQMVNQGAFREDLYFRLAVLPVTVPPLRERVEDIPLLAEHFLPANAPSVLDAALLRDLAARPWLGNVRELRSFVERAVAFGPTRALSLSPPAPGDSAPDRWSPPVPIDRPFKAGREAWTDHFDREFLRQLLEIHHRNVAAVAQAAGIDRTYVYRMMQKHGL